MRVYPIRGKPGQSQKTFESTAELQDFEPDQEIIVRSFWASDAIGYSIAGAFAGLVVLVFSWFYGFGLGWLAAVFAFVVGVGLHVLKIVLHRPPSEPKTDSTVVKVEHWDEEKKHVLLVEFDERITLEILQRVAKAIESGANWSRPSLTVRAKISQGKYHLLNSEFQRLHYVSKINGNNYSLSFAGKAFLREVLRS